MTDVKIKYSVIVLLEEEQEGFALLIRNLYELFSSRGEPFEIIIISNGAGGFLRNQLEYFRGINKIQAFEFNSKVTEAACLKAGVKESAGEILFVCGSYQQLSIDSLSLLLDALEDGVDIVSPWRESRVDSSLNQLQSKVFNTLVRKITKSNLHDLGCTFKVLRRKVLEQTELYGDMYRFLPILSERNGFITKEVKCDHYQQRGRKGFQNLLLVIPRLIDILALFFNTRFSKNPLRFFSGFGFLFLIIGMLILSYVFIQRFFMGNPIGGRPGLLLALLFMILGIQSASVGLLGEIITFTHGRQKKEYVIEKII